MLSPRWGFGIAALQRLQEYRTTLITAVVTGKIDVRHESKFNSIAQ